MAGDDVDDTNMFLGGLEDCHINLRSPLTYKTHSKEWSPMVVIRDFSTCATNAATHVDLTIFPPTNHENLTPSHYNPQPIHHPPPFPSPPLSPPPSFSPDFDHSSPPLPPPPPPPVASPFPRWWGLAAQILRLRISGIGSYFRRSDKRTFWSFGNVALAATVVLWWLCVRLRRKWQRRKSVAHLMQIITEKDEKIMELLNQIAQMNQLLLTRHKVLASKLGD